MPESSLLRRILLPELELTKSWFFSGHDHTHLEVRKTSTIEVCPRCATPSGAIYDHRVARIRDAPIRDRQVMLHIRKRRFSCKKVRKALHRADSGHPQRGALHRALQAGGALGL